MGICYSKVSSTLMVIVGFKTSLYYISLALNIIILSFFFLSIIELNGIRSNMC